MKKLYLYMMVALTIIACAESGTDNKGTEPESSIVLSTTSVSFNSDNANYNLSFTSTLSWEADVVEGDDWCSIDIQSGVAGSAKISIQALANEALTSRFAKIIVKTAKDQAEVTVSQSAISRDKLKQKERDALIAFYQDAGGDNWTNNTNWCSNKPISEWFGIYVDSDGFVQYLALAENNLIGAVKDELKDLLKIHAVDVNRNQLTELDVANLTSLEELYCGHNQITELDVANLTSLEKLYCGNNQITELDVANLTSLEKLYCGNNQITELDVANLTSLEELNCGNNQITELDVSNSPNLEYLYAWGNEELTIYITREQDFEYSISGYTQFVYKGESSELYGSTDFSKDGEVKVLQTASVGNGIDIVLMGDAFSDRLIADGTYDSVMNTAMEQFFEIEPYKSFRNYFNVYLVTAVSKNEVYTKTSSTVFGCLFGEGTHIDGVNGTVLTYARKIIPSEKMDDTTIVVILNSTVYAGTCHSYGPSEGDWGDGVAIAYCTMDTSTERLGQVVHHEAGGHGFAKLGDEYVRYETVIPGSEISSAQYLQSYGWRKNIDFTSDRNQVKWNYFLSDSRYRKEVLGVYEGAYLYRYGAYRPTQNSIMNQNYGGFNAPSREAIYYRIHKLAYGADWQYDYEEFVEWDVKNRATSSATRGIPYRSVETGDFQPTHPPVFINKSWQEELHQ